MLPRAGAAACAAAIAGMILVPAELTARGAAGHFGGFRPIMRPMHHVHPPMARPVRRPFPPFVHHHPARFLHGHFHERNRFHAIARRHHRGIFTVPLFGYGVPVTYDDAGAFVGTYYDPSDGPGPLILPVYAAPPAPAPPLAGLPDPPAERVGCRSQTVAVPTPGGAERSVTITRC
jgi:hypothetical protein